MIEARRASPEDAAALLPLVSQYWQFEGVRGFESTAVLAQLQRLLSSPELGAAWLASDAQTPVGYSIVVYVFSLEHGGITAEIDEIFVVPEHRGSGLGSRLLIEAEAESIRHGCTNISLQIGTTNQRASEFYRRHGYAWRSAFRVLDKSLGPVRP